VGAANFGSGMGTYLDLQSIGAIVVTYGEIDDPNMRYFNPAICWEGDKLRIALRSCNFAVRRLGSWYFRDGSAYSKTDVIYGDLDPDTLQFSKLTKLKLSKDSPIVTKLAGLEDVRLFMRKDGMHAIGFQSDRLTRSLHNESATLAEYLIKGDTLKYLRTLSKPYKDIVEKNWQPTDKPSTLFDFTYSISQVWKDGELIGDKYKGEIHGGSQLLEQQDGTYLSLVHEKIADRRYGNVYDKYVYITYLARHNKKGIVTHLSEPFRFGTNENIEFASSMVEYKGDLIISLGIRDCKYALVKIEKEKLVKLLKPIEEITQSNEVRLSPRELRRQRRNVV